MVRGFIFNLSGRGYLDLHAYADCHDGKLQNYVSGREDQGSAGKAAEDLTPQRDPMPESLKTKIMRRWFNFFPAYRGTGARLTYIARDWREVRIKVPLNWRTRNYVGTIFGGSMYGAVDPVYMLMLIKILGPEYVVWDKTASIRFKRPGTGTLYAKFVVSDEEAQAIKTALLSAPSVERVYVVELIDSEGISHATVEKTIYIRRKDGVGRVTSKEENRRMT